MSHVWDEIKDGLRFGPVRRWFARVRRFPHTGPSELDHVHLAKLRNLLGSDPVWESSSAMTVIEKHKRRYICASCKRRGWHWEEYEANAGIMKRKATCLGNGEYHDGGLKDYLDSVDRAGFQSDLDSMGGTEEPPRRDPRNPFYR